MVNAIYLAGPVDLGQDINWKTLLADKLKAAEVNVTLFDPASAFKVTNANMSREMSEYIEDVNTQALVGSDMMVLSLPKGVQSIGTIIELDLAHTTGHRTLVLSDLDYKTSAYLNNRIASKIQFVSTKDDNGNLDVDNALDTIVGMLVAENG